MKSREGFLVLTVICVAVEFVSANSRKYVYSIFIEYTGTVKVGREGRAKT